MSEMLGNHYFLLKDYAEAIKAYSHAFNDNLPKSIIKKIIICYLTQENIITAQNYFLKLIKEDPALLYNTDYKKEECPCHELIEKYEAETISTENEIVRLGILWFYCDLNISKKYFERTLLINSNNKFVQEILNMLNILTEKKEKGEK